MPAYKLKIALDESKPKITRTVAVPEDASLADLHSIIQSVMGWQDYHLHRFIVDDREYLPYIDEDRGPDDGIEEKTPLSLFKGEKIHYNYDFGDDWWITVSWLKDIERYDLPWPELIDWKEDSPPEDCGGIRGYYDLLRILADPDDERHDDMVEWAGDIGFDEETVENSLQTWAVQGIMPDDPVILPDISRMAIMIALGSFIDEPLVFDMKDGSPLVLKETRTRKSKRRGPDPEPPSVSPSVAEKDPERYIPLAGPGKERIADLVGSFAAEHPEFNLDAAFEENYQSFFEVLEHQDLVDDFNMFCVVSFMKSTHEWARENRIYFMTEEPDLPVAPTESFAKYLHEHEDEIDFDDPQSVERFIQEYNSQLR